MGSRALVIVGDSSFAEVASELFDEQGEYQVVAFAVHAAFRKRDMLLGREVLVLEELETLCPAASHDIFVALTYRELNRARARICAEMRDRGYRLASYVSPQAFVWRNVRIGDNCFIFENNVIQPFCTLADNVILWSGNHIGHHTAIFENVFVASHVVISGHCRIGRNSFFGVNATVADGVTIGADNWIGPATLITKDTEDGAMYRAESTPKSTVASTRFFRIKAT